MTTTTSVVVMLAIVAMLLGMLGVDASISCLGENGKPVDWWFIYKMPGGFQFAYKDATDHAAVPLSINSQLLNRTETGALGATLHQIYQAKKSDSLASVLWNDEHPDAKVGASPDASDDASAVQDEHTPEFDARLKAKLEAAPFPGGGGHTKGVLALDTQGGFYLLHSVPKFPDLRFATFTWNASIVYGQTFLCMSLDRLTALALGSHLQWINPDLFDVHLPPSMATLYPSINALVTGARAQGAHKFEFHSVGGTAFTAFGKSNNWGADLYEDLVNPGLKVGFDWQTWRRGGEIPSFCAPPAPYNSSNILQTTVGSYSFSFTRDHAKWGASTAGGWVCVGDINRMYSQRKRGGGTVCHQNPALHYALHRTIVQREPCK